MAEENEKREETIRVSGTLDAISAYIVQKLGLDPLDAAKAATLLWLEQECECADLAKNSELNVGLKSLREFGDNGEKAQGMVADSRVFISAEGAMVMALASIPAQIVEDILCQSEIDQTAVKILFKVANIIRKNGTVIPDSLACVCMRAWRCVKRQVHIPFHVDDVMPGREYPRDEASGLVCDLTQDDGRQRLKAAKWSCPYHRDGNHCCLTPALAGQMLDVLEQQGVLVAQGTAEAPGGKSYLFL